MRAFFNELSDNWTLTSECQSQMVRLLEEHFESLESGRAIQGKSNALRTHLNRLTDVDQPLEGRFRATSKVSVSNRGAPDRASFRVDLRLECLTGCERTHFLNVELCLNNREAIGTNILKPEIMARTHKGENHAGLLICASRDLLLSGNWDASYADDSEYLVAYKLVYHSVMSAPIGLMQISA